jgi:hypothetical protein
MIIKQVRVSNNVIFFAKDLMKKWELNSYNNVNEPCLFFGVYDESDVNIIKNHKGFKLVWFTNSDSKDLINKLVSVDNLVINYTEGLNLPKGIKFKKTSIAIKDFSNFTPTTLGDKIYCYIGNGHTGNKHGFPIVKEIEKLVDFEIIYGKIGRDLECVKQDYYNNCFININITETGRSGLTTLTEMGFMGRYSISNTLDNFPCVIRYKNTEEIVKIINEESKKIGTIQPSLLDNHFYTSEEWKNVDFWLI